MLPYESSKDSTNMTSQSFRSHRPFRIRESFCIFFHIHVRSFKTKLNGRALLDDAIWQPSEVIWNSWLVNKPLIELNRDVFQAEPDLRWWERDGRWKRWASPSSFPPPQVINTDLLMKSHSKTLGKWLKYTYVLKSFSPDGSGHGSVSSRGSWRPLSRNQNSQLGQAGGEVGKGSRADCS